MKFLLKNLFDVYDWCIGVRLSFLWKTIPYLLTTDYDTSVLLKQNRKNKKAILSTEWLFH
ncbi:MAG: hypothetical protein EOO87_05095 [Pedobacter sp.]|nr:MAG: hypothetical protein EOO87_05095 [Pedobacter sp.]